MKVFFAKFSAALVSRACYPFFRETFFHEMLLRHVSRKFFVAKVFSYTVWWFSVTYEVHNGLVIFVFFFSFQTNTFQGMLVTDFNRSYAIFISRCGDLTFSAPGKIGFSHFYFNFLLGASTREEPHLIACINEPVSPWVNLAWPVAFPRE